MSPGRLRGGRPGVLLCGLFILAVALGCDRVPGLGGGEEIELDEGSVRLPPGADLHEVSLSMQDGREVVDPARVTATTGDAVRFVVEDGAGHAIAFDEGALGAEARAFLTQTLQQASPPLVSPGDAWIFSLEDAPAGTYTFHCLSHGRRGSIVVETAAAQ